MTVWSDLKGYTITPSTGDQDLLLTSGAVAGDEETLNTSGISVVLRDGFARQIFVGMASDATATDVDIVISGTRIDGMTSAEALNGPSGNATGIEGTVFFASVTSITTTGATPSGLFIGFGVKAFGHSPTRLRSWIATPSTTTDGYAFRDGPATTSGSIRQFDFTTRACGDVMEHHLEGAGVRFASGMVVSLGTGVLSLTTFVE